MAIQDSRFDSLRAQGFTGSNDDMMLQWAKAAGAVSNHTNDAVLEALLLNGATTPNLSDAWVEYLVSIGGNGTRNDMELLFWESGGVISPPSPSSPFDDHWARVQDKSDPTLGTHLSTLFDELILKGIWDQLTDLCVFHSSASDSLLGLKGVVDSVNINDCAFDEIQGFFCGDDGQDRYIDTGIAKAKPVPGMDDDNMSAFMYRQDRSDSAAGAIGSMGSIDGGTNALALAIASNTNGNYTAGTAVPTATQTTAERNKFIGVSRLNANDVVTIRDNVSQTATVASTGGAPSVNTVMVGGVITDTVFNSSLGTEMVLAWGVGAALTETQLQDLNAAIDAYVTSRHAVIPQTAYLNHVNALNNKRTEEELESNIARLFEELQDAGLYEKFDEIWVNHASADDMRIGIKGLKIAVPVGGPSWARGGGFSVGNGGGTAMYLNTLMLDDGTTNFTDDSMSIFFWRRFTTTGASANAGTMGALDGGGRDVFMNTNTNDSSDARLGHAPPNNTITGSGKGFFGASQDSNTTGAMISPTASITTASTASAGSPKTFEIYAGGINDQGSYVHSQEDERLAAWGVGGGLTEAELVTLSGIIETYLTNILSV